MNMFDMGMYGMMHPDERRKILERGSLYTAGGDQAVQNKEPWHKGFFWSKGKKDQDQDQGQGISLSDAGPLGPMQMQFDKRGNVLNQGSAILPSGQVVGIPDKQKQRYEPPIQKTGTLKPFHPSQGGQGDKGFHNNETEQLKWWQTLANKAGIDFSKAAASWKEKGGFEGLMSNPAFTMGLAFMQAGAEGKTLGSGALNNVMKAAGISSHYKRLMEAKSGGVIEATTGQMDDVKSILGTMGISGPGWRKMLPGNQSESYEQAVEDITIKVQQKVNKMKEDAKNSGKDIVVGSRLKKKIIKDMIDSGEISKKRVFLDETLESKPVRARGGPVTKGKAYVVGEEGPEVIIPHSSGNVLSTDDSQIFAMLLAANPQLQKVSKARAEKIMRSRFPEYFE